MSITINYKGLNNNEIKNIQKRLNLLNPILGLGSMFNWEIYFCSLNQKETLHKEYMQSPFKGNNSYRALTHTKHKKTFIFLNDKETIDSILWVFLHELTHINILHNEYLNKICKTNFNKILVQNNIKTIQEYESKLDDDNFHELFMEEQLANNFATEIIGFNYNRIWWRNQLKKENN